MKPQDTHQHGWAGVTWACQRLYRKWKDTLDQTLAGYLEQSEILRSLIHPKGMRTPPLPCWWYPLVAPTPQIWEGAKEHMFSCPIPYVPATAAVILGAGNFQAPTPPQPPQEAGNICRTLPGQVSQAFLKPWPSSSMPPHLLSTPLIKKKKNNAGFHWSL